MDTDSATATSTSDDKSDSKRRRVVVDRLSNLPEELVIRILSLLPTKDAAATCFSCKKLRPVLCLLTSIDIDDSPISHCLQYPNKIHKFPTFLTFVDNVLQQHHQSHSQQYLARFRLGVGLDMLTQYVIRCSRQCKPHVDPTHTRSWISFPLTRNGLKELDLRIHVREPAHGHQLPPEIFTCQTLEVLKLDVNLPLVDHHPVSTTIRLPLLKLLHLRVSHIYGDGRFVSRLVSCCPSLEDLNVEAILLDHVQSINISSPSLRILNLNICCQDRDTTDFLCLDTPNLESLCFCSNLALQQYITNMDHCSKGTLITWHVIPGEPHVSCQQILSFLRCLTNVHTLSLRVASLRVLNVDVLKDQLPMFRNLTYLELGNDHLTCWDKVLEAFLTHSPVLETLVFPQKMIGDVVSVEKVHLEQEFFRRDLAVIPWCCKFHLKRIVFENFYGNKREIGLIQFLLKHALVLEELVISQIDVRYTTFPSVDKVELLRTLQTLPRASPTCSIQVF